MRKHRPHFVGNAQWIFERLTFGKAISIIGTGQRLENMGIHGSSGMEMEFTEQGLLLLRLGTGLFNHRDRASQNYGSCNCECTESFH